MSANRMSESGAAYPARLEIDYPLRGLNRGTTLFRPILMVPIVVVAGLMGSVLVAPVLLMILFRRKYPRWWFDWNLELTRFTTRVNAYALLLRDEYPSTDEEQAVHLEFDYPDDLNRWLPLVKWLLALPHYIVLSVLGVIALVATAIAWLAILFTGRYPFKLFNFVLGVGRWTLRVEAYAFLLITDRYPPFSVGE